MAGWNPMVCDRFHNSDSDLPHRRRNSALLCAHSEGFSFVIRQASRTAGAFSFYSTLCRAWRRTGMARIRAAAVAGTTHTIDRKPDSRFGLGALALAAI